MRALLLSALLLALSAPLTAGAVDHSKHTVGLGVVTQFAGGPAGGRPDLLSAKFFLQPRLEASLLFGLRFGDGTAFVPGAKAAYVLLPEKNMNLYAAVAFAVDVRTSGGLVAFTYQLGPGVEFFFEDFPNLGFSLEFGLGGQFASGSDNSSIFTNSTGVGNAGIHYYF